ncbi:MAG: hypothetical protein ACRDP6_42015 [Actinoallomurus sp.]
MALMPPGSGLIAMRIAQEFGPPEEFAHSLERALELGGERGATLVALLDRGDLMTHIPQVDGPSWNTVPLIHLHHGDEPSADDWATANAIVERLERYR